MVNRWVYQFEHRRVTVFQEKGFLKYDIKFLENTFEEIHAIQDSWKPAQITVAVD